jgi:hypothetical protein
VDRGQDEDADQYERCEDVDEASPEDASTALPRTVRAVADVRAAKLEVRIHVSDLPSGANDAPATNPRIAVAARSIAPGGGRLFPMPQLGAYGGALKIAWSWGSLHWSDLTSRTPEPPRRRAAGQAPSGCLAPPFGSQPRPVPSRAVESPVDRWRRLGASRPLGEIEEEPAWQNGLPLCGRGVTHVDPRDCRTRDLEQRCNC